MAHDFLTRSFAPTEMIAVLLRREVPVSTTQRVVALERVLVPRYLGWLSHENATGANIYVAANPLHTGSRKRTKESIASIRHLYIDIDTDGDARLAALLASEAVPTPTAILSTSPGKFQILWRVNSFDFARQEQTLKLLAVSFGGDPRLYRLQPSASPSRFPELQVRSCGTVSRSNIPAIPSGLPPTSGLTWP